jgi:hypothetical protein
MGLDKYRCADNGNRAVNTNREVSMEIEQSQEEEWKSAGTERSRWRGSGHLSHKEGELSATDPIKMEVGDLHLFT